MLLLGRCLHNSPFGGDEESIRCMLAGNVGFHSVVESNSTFLDGEIQRSMPPRATSCETMTLR